MKRREFVKVFGIGAAAVSLTTFGFASTSPKTDAAEIIRRELSFLQISRNDVDMFIEDFFRTSGNFTGLYSKIQFRSLNLLKVKAENSGLVEFLVSSFLWSSDFFLNKMDEKKPVKYLGIPNPYLNPCSNPFSSFYYPS